MYRYIGSKTLVKVQFIFFSQLDFIMIPVTVDQLSSVCMVFLPIRFHYYSR